ncbi:MAG: hypothetical protein HZB34_07750 [Nitrospirae bacterium]|nr:hypothetical protein [Nitrospirota bacterium]
MSEEQKAAYLKECQAENEAMLDRIFLKVFGRTWRLDEADLERAAHLATLPHGEQNGDSSRHPPDSLQKIKADFPDLFGTGKTENP